MNKYIMYLIRLSENGDPEKQNMLGIEYYTGIRVQQDYKEAAKWFIKSAQQGNATAQCNLGYLYLDGLGVEQNYQEAIKLFEKASKQGKEIATCELGYLYQEGLGVEQNYAESAKWYEEAARQGYELAQNAIVFLYLCGLGVQKDYSIAEKLSREFYNKGGKELKYYVDIFDKFKAQKVKEIKSIAELIGKDVEEDIDAIFIKPDKNLDTYAHTLYDIETFKKIKKNAEKILEDIPRVKEDKSNEYEVFEKICIKIVSLIEYDFDLINGKNEKKIEKAFSSRNLIGALLKGKCVCAGYAELLRNLCECKGIECIYVCSNWHAFNQVKINDNWYYFDLHNASEKIKYGSLVENFLQSKESFVVGDTSHIPLKSQITYESPCDFKDRNKQQGATMGQIVNALGHEVSAKDVKSAEIALNRLNVQQSPTQKQVK